MRMLAMMLPLIMLLWAIAYGLSLHFINETFDRSLARRTYALADRVEVQHGEVKVDLPVAARQVLAFDQQDLLFHRVTDPKGRVVDGEAEMPPLPARRGIRPGQLVFYDGSKDGGRVRVAAFALSLQGTSAHGVALIQVGETLARRTAMAERATLAIVVPTLLMMLIAGIAIAYGVGKGLEPVARLRDRLSTRRALDLSPVPLEGTPAELRPFLDEINSLLARLAEAVDAQSRFVADAAHQLRTPIAGIRAQAEAALASAEPDAARHALMRIAESSQGMGELVQKLLVLARVDAAENTLRLQAIESVELVRTVALEWAPRALAQGVEVGFEARGARSEILGEPQLLRELLANLIDNALRYGGSRVALAVESDVQGGVIWRVADNGPGIPESDRHAVFAAFHRLSTAPGGAGLGLTIVQRIARLHGATVDLGAGAAGVGLVVSVVFPAAPF
ncbi:MAG: sensor histidine kinase [Thiobacillus sp.]